MSAQLINGRRLAEQIKDDIVTEIKKLPERPNLAIILVGNRPDSTLYVSLKERESKKVGIDTNLYKFDAHVSEDDLLSCIGYLNDDDTIDGILLQLPLPDGFNEDRIVAAINPDKDVDGFHPKNLEHIKNRRPAIMPPLAAVIMEMLKSVRIDLQGTTITLVANSDIFAAGVSEILQQHGATTISAHPDDTDVRDKTKQADVIVTAVGRKQYLNRDYCKPGCTVIDIGIVRDDERSEGSQKIYGDVDMDSVSEVADYISPVPGGVGPMTIACAFRNVVEIYRKNRVALST